MRSKERVLHHVILTLLMFSSALRVKRQHCEALLMFSSALRVKRQHCEAKVNLKEGANFSLYFREASSWTVSGIRIVFLVQPFVLCTLRTFNPDEVIWWKKQCLPLTDFGVQEKFLTRARPQNNRGFCSILSFLAVQFPSFSSLVLREVLLLECLFN